LRGRFPRNLNGAPALLPTQNTATRRDLEKWFREVGVVPRVIAEFEDAALAKIVAGDGLGFTTVPTIVAEEAMERYGFVALGKTESCQTQLFLITAERHIDHPAVVFLREGAMQEVVRRRNKPSAAGKRRAADRRPRSRS
jgi:LysR family transcriptional activator of nhaA